MATCGGYTYRLRAASPMPVANGGGFVLHSFMAEGQQQVTETCTTLPAAASSSFQGQGGSFVSASYTRLVAAGALYRSTVSTGVRYIEEIG